MKSSAISFRVADFLKQYAPFRYVDEGDLLALAMRGRVKFHEGGELVFEKGRAVTPQVYVLQQGRVQILDQAGGLENLRDLLGAGDLLGIDFILGDETYQHTARTDGEVILYALEGKQVLEVLRNYPEASSYLAAYFSVVGDAAEAPLNRPVSSDFARRALLTCGPSTAVRDVARSMRDAGADTVAVTDPAGCALGVVAIEDLRDRVATGEVAIDAPVRAVMRSELPVAAPNRSAAEYFTAMLRCDASAVGITENGAHDAPLVGMVTGAAALLAAGDTPLLLAKQIRYAADLAELAQIRRQAEEFLRRNLPNSSILLSIASLASELHRLLLQRVGALAKARLSQGGRSEPDVPSCWLFFGSAGRGELLSSFDLEWGLLHDDWTAASDASYFEALAQEVGEGLREIGFVCRDGSGPKSAPLGSWRRAFSDWIMQPVLNETYAALSYFDLRFCGGSPQLVEALRQHVREEIAAHPDFVRVLANDSLANLPPLTFFQGRVVQEEGVAEETLDIWRYVLQPLTDLGRVWALAQGEVVATSTAARLEDGGAGFLEGVLLEEARDAFVLALYHRARRALADGSDGTLIKPADLNKYEQQLLKGAFRAIANLIEHTAAKYKFTVQA